MVPFSGFSLGCRLPPRQRGNCELVVLMGSSNSPGRGAHSGSRTHVATLRGKVFMWIAMTL